MSLTIRLEDAKNIEVSKAHEPKAEKEKHHDQKPIIPDTERAENFITESRKIPCRKGKH